MRANRKFVLELAIAENFDRVGGAADEAMRPQQFGCNRLTLGEHVQFLEIDDGVLDAERIVKAALRNAAVQRHLSAFEPAAARIAAARFLSLVAGTGCLAELRTHTSSHAYFALAGAAGRLER